MKRNTRRGIFSMMLVDWDCIVMRLGLGFSRREPTNSHLLLLTSVCLYNKRFHREAVCCISPDCSPLYSLITSFFFFSRADDSLIMLWLPHLPLIHSALSYVTNPCYSFFSTLLPEQVVAAHVPPVDSL